MTDVNYDISPENIEPVRRESVFNFLDVALIAAASIVFIIAGSWLLTRIMGGDPTNPEGPSLIFNAAMAGLETLALVGSIAIFGLWRKKLPLSAVGLKKPRTNWLVAAIVITLLIIPLMSLVALVIQSALGQPMGNPQLEFMVPENFSWPGAIGMLLMGGITVPIAEELFFRGVLYQWMRSLMNVWIAIPLNALIFGALHGDFAIAGATALIGLLLAWFFERSHSLWPSIIIHITNNALKLFLLYILIAAGVDISGF